MNCPQCGSDAVWKKFGDHHFEYGYPKSVTLTVHNFPTGRCEPKEGQ
jgi:hypothetical protein